MRTYFDGLSGEDIVTMPDDCIRDCSASGAVDDAVSAWVDDDQVTWHADPETIRSMLRECGAWDDEQLADDEQNRHRALWVAACDLADDFSE